MNRCMPQAGQFNPVSSLMGHLGQKQYCVGLHLYNANSAMKAIAKSVYLLMYLTTAMGWLYVLQYGVQHVTTKDAEDDIDGKAHSYADDTPFLSFLRG